MAASVNQPNITITLTTADDCSAITLIDATGEYDAESNPLGYGLPDGVAINDVTELQINLTSNRQGHTLEFVFTIEDGTITAATLSLSGADAEDILTALSTVSFPFTSENPFDLFAYGTPLPDFIDDVWTVEYVISGTAEDAFEFTSSQYKKVTCATECCLKNKWMAIDPNCGCFMDQMREAMLAQTHLKQVEYAAEDGDVDRAVTALNAAEEYCSDCDEC